MEEKNIRKDGKDKNVLEGNLKESLKITGQLTLEHKKEDGTTEIHEYKNLIVDTGFNFIGDVIANPTQPSIMNHIAVGSGTTAAAVGDTDLETILDVRNPATFIGVSDTVFTLASTFAGGESTGAWTEAGVFNALTLGIMLNRLIFPVVNKLGGDTITATFTFTLA